MDITIGTKVEINEPVFHGYPKSRPAGERKIIGTVLKDSYGAKRGQHTFTIEVEEASGFDAPEAMQKIRRKGRTLYKNCKVIKYPENHHALKQEKHARGDAAVDDKYWGWIEEVWDHPEKVRKIPASWFMKNPKALLALEDFVTKDFDPVKFI
jgi:hypothetical protein